MDDVAAPLIDSGEYPYLLLNDRAYFLRCADIVPNLNWSMSLSHMCETGRVNALDENGRRIYISTSKTCGMYNRV